ncbi:hypothetical protein ACQKL6_17150 [Peribacillus sp. NPDC097197]|uniref:hypothetical protein n=1 Tax=unclassified Peribacillus TaxID=2675266 RepID=UPI00380DE541
MSEKKNRNDENKDDKLDRESNDCDCSKESSEESCKESREESCKESCEDDFFRELNEFIGEELLVVTETAQLNLLGQTFRPIFVGPLVEVEEGHITLFPVTIKILNAPFFKFPTPLSIPLEKIAHFTPGFDSDTRFPLV